jgi:mono/diheme cytochrome c family protein
MSLPRSATVFLLSAACISAVLMGEVSCSSPPTQQGQKGTTGSTGPTGATGPTGPTTSLTYYKDVKAIIDAKCIGCHTTGGIGPFDLTTYEGVHAEGALIAPNVQTRTMPPWMPSTDTPALVGDRSLSDAQISTIVSWVQGGMPEGNPADAPMETPPSTSFTVDASMTPQQPYTPSTAEGTDDYHCFVLDPTLTTDTAVTAFNIVPGNRQIVHHVLLFAVPPADLSSLQTLEASGSGNGYTCFGSSGVNGANLVAGWVPGTAATVFTPGTGIVVKAGSKLVMQVHYNLLNVPNPMQPPSDQTTAQLQYGAVSSITQSEFYPIAQTSFDIPVGQIQTVTQTLDTGSLGAPTGTPIYVYGVTPHMHLHGTDIQVTVTHADSSTELLMHVPKWQFQWQELYFYQNYLTVHIGDKVTLACTFDNTPADQPYIAGKQETAQPLTWGEDTLNEMCLTYLYVASSPPKQ